MLINHFSGHDVQSLPIVEESVHRNAIPLNIDQDAFLANVDLIRRDVNLLAANSGA